MAEAVEFLQPTWGTWVELLAFDYPLVLTDPRLPVQQAFGK